LAIPLGHSAFVNRGAILYLPLPEQQKTDSLYWTLFAQLAADVKGNRETDPVAWYKEYIRILQITGMRSNNWSRDTASGSEAEDSVDTTLLRYLKPFLSPDAQVKLVEIINALGKKANKKALHIFNSLSSDSSSANFQVSDGTVDRSLNLTIHASYMDFRTHQHIKNLLFWRWTDRDFTFSYAKDTLTLPKNLADRLRQQIRNRVANHIVKNIDSIELA